LRLERLAVAQGGGWVVRSDGVDLRPVPAEKLRVVALPAGEGDELVVGDARGMARDLTPR
jgi:hypothetical protein